MWLQWWIFETVLITERIVEFNAWLKRETIIYDPIDSLIFRIVINRSIFRKRIKKKKEYFWYFRVNETKN